MTKQVEVTCPCCSNRLVIDVRTETVLRTAAPEQVDETGKVVLDEGRWDSAKDRIQESSGSREARFDKALSKEREREGDLDDLFEKAKRKALGGSEEEES